MKRGKRKRKISFFFSGLLRIVLIRIKPINAQLNASKVTIYAFLKCARLIVRHKKGAKSPFLKQVCKKRYTLNCLIDCCNSSASRATSWLDSDVCCAPAVVSSAIPTIVSSFSLISCDTVFCSRADSRHGQFIQCLCSLFSLCHTRRSLLFTLIHHRYRFFSTRLKHFNHCVDFLCRFLRFGWRGFLLHQQQPQSLDLVHQHALPQQHSRRAGWFDLQHHG